MGLANRAAAITPPVLGENIWGLDAADVTPAVWFTIPAAWYGNIIEFEADGEDFYFAIGGGDLTDADLVASNKSTYSANQITAVGSVAAKVKDGTVKPLDLSMVDKKHKLRMAVVGASGTSGNLLRITRASGYVNKTAKAADLISP